MGHMHMIRKGIWSTIKPTIVDDIMNKELEKEPQLDLPRHIINQENTM